MFASELVVTAEGFPGQKSRPRLGVRNIRLRNVLIVGSGQLAANIAAQLQNEPTQRYRLVDWIGTGRAKNSMEDDLKRLREIAAREGVGTLVVALSERRGAFPTEELLACRRNGIKVEDGVAFYEKLSRRISLVGLNPSALIFNDGFKRLRLMMVCKRFIDILISGVGLIVTMPLWIVLALAIKLDTHGPVFFCQERIGRDEELFQLFKFRSMHWEPGSRGDSRWANEEDTRVTRVGRIIRRWHLDELPQLWNVLKGDISFVGPRPDVIPLRDLLERGVPYYSFRTAVNPGITGLAQVRYHYVSTVQEAIARHEYDLYYIKNQSLVLDFRIIVETFKTILMGKGAR